MVENDPYGIQEKIEREMLEADKRANDARVAAILDDAGMLETYKQKARALINRTWSKDTLKRVLSEGLEPAGTRYDAAWKQVHILCTNGQNVVVPLAELEAADDAPRIILP